MTTYEYSALYEVYRNSMYAKLVWLYWLANGNIRVCIILNQTLSHRSFEHEETIYAAILYNRKRTILSSRFMWRLYAGLAVIRSLSSEHLLAEGDFLNGAPYRIHYREKPNP